MAFTAILSYRYLMPRSLADVTDSLVAALFSVSNFYFWFHSGYFDAPALNEPLLHTWSLAVEEQFYVVLPILLAVSHRLSPRWTKPAIVAVALASFAASAVSVGEHPDMTFYMLHTRAWELLLGAMVSLRIVPELRWGWMRQAASLTGAGLIAYSVLFYTASTPFPGIAALPPCLGAALIIAAGRGGRSLVGWVLALPPMRFIGLISYSLYLWHWPLLVFQKSDGLLVDGSPRMGKAAVLVASLIAATLSWQFIEKPFRRPRVLTRRGVFYAAGGGAAAMLAGAAFLLLAPSRFPPEVVAIADYEGDPGSYMSDGRCFISTQNVYSDYDRADCLAQVAGRKNYLLVGDSHAAHLAYGISQVFGDVHLMEAAAAGCKPMLAYTEGRRACNAVMDYVFNHYLVEHHVDKLLLAARWSEADLPALAATLDWARSRGIPVVVFGPIVEYDSTLPRLLALSIERHDPGLPARHHLEEGDLDRKISSLSAAKSETDISLDQVLCPEGTCILMAKAGVPLQFDYSHLTRDGSVLLAQRLDRLHLLP
jgi:peptidoglycan/LPS O-acetylase OafA/YrhL